MTRSIATCLALCTAATLAAQSAAAPPADFMRSIGKLYVVVAVIVVVFLGLAFYLWRLDRRLTDLENQIDDHA
ncbi:MAG: CcmD family protein [Bacteroidota bacterium]